MSDLFEIAASTLWLHTGLGPGAALTVLAQTLLCIACMACARRTGVATQAGRFWLAASLTLAALAVLGAWRADRSWVLWMRDVVQAQGWYLLRRPLQWLAAATLMLAALALLLRSGGWLRAQPDARGVRLATIGLLMLALVLGLRLISLHQIDLWLQASLGGVSLGRALEGLGLALLALGCALPSPRPAARWRNLSHV